MNYLNQIASSFSIILTLHPRTAKLINNISAAELGLSHYNRITTENAPISEIEFAINQWSQK